MRNLLLVLIGFRIICTLFEGPRHFLESLAGSAQPDSLSGKVVSAAAGSVGQLSEVVSELGNRQVDLPDRIRNSISSLEAQAKQGAADAQYRLSLVYEQANLIEEAHAWASIASRNGSKLAKQTKDRLSRAMDGSQRARSQSLADKLLSKP